MNLIALRGFLVDGKPDAASKIFKDGLKIYPLAQAKNPPADAVHQRLKEGLQHDPREHRRVLRGSSRTCIEKEPIDFLDPELRGLAAGIGLRKGKPFAPDARMKAILVDAAAVANATARAMAFQTRDPEAFYYEESQWKTAFVGGDYKWLIDGGSGGRNQDARTLFFYQATLNTPAMVAKIPGVGSQYAYAERDTDGNYLDGAKNLSAAHPRRSRRPRISGPSSLRPANALGG